MPVLLPVCRASGGNRDKCTIHAHPACISTSKIWRPKGCDRPLIYRHHQGLGFMQSRAHQRRALRDEVYLSKVKNSSRLHAQMQLKPQVPLKARESHPLSHDGTGSSRNPASQLQGNFSKQICEAPG